VYNSDLCFLGAKLILGISVSYNNGGFGSLLPIKIDILTTRDNLQGDMSVEEPSG